MERLSALAATQRALLEKIAALDEQEASEQARIEEIDNEDGQEDQASGEQDVLAMLMHKQQELQRMRSAISELQQLQSGVQSLLGGGAPAQAASAAPAGSDQYEQDFLQGLLRKRAELQRMQAALAGITGETDSMRLGDVDEEEEAPAAADGDNNDDDDDDDDDDELVYLTKPASASRTARDPFDLDD